MFIFLELKPSACIGRVHGGTPIPDLQLTLAHTQTQ